jgi:phosphomannomutase
MTDTAFTAADSPEPLIVSVSGLRGVVGQTLTPEVAADYAAAFAATLPAGRIVIGRDGRESGPVLAAAITARLAFAGRDVIDCGVAATPTVGIAVREYDAVGGIQISASHNPARYNGMKLFAAAGRVLTAAAGREVLAAFELLRKGQDGRRLKHAHPQPASPAGEHAARTGEVVAADPTAAHLQLVLGIIDVAAIRRCAPRVWIDCGHGAGSRLAIPLLESLGCEVVAEGTTPDGQFAHDPEPTAENLAGLLPQIPLAHADIGFFQDPDADRLAIADAAGCFLGEEATLALCVEGVLAKSPGPVVVNCSTSGMTAAIAARLGQPCQVSAVGEANVVDAMLAQGAVLGGEGNGGVIDPRVVLVRDSFVAMAFVLERMCASEQMTPIAKLAAALPRMVMKKTKLALSPATRGAGLEAGLDRIAAAFPEARASRLDGLRLDWPGGWLLVRASNTEPVVRLVAEQLLGDGSAAAASTAVEEALDRAAVAMG